MYTWPCNLLIGPRAGLIQAIPVINRAIRAGLMSMGLLGCSGDLVSRLNT